MKKVVRRILSGMCVIVAITISLISFSACSSMGSRDESVYKAALALIEEAKQTEYRNDAIQKYEEAIQKLETIPDYAETAKTLENAKTEHDKMVVEEVKFCYRYGDYFDIDDNLSKMYDQKKAESITVWRNYSEEIIRAYYNTIVKAIKSQLKNPNSFTDVGSSYSYTVKVGNEERAVIVQKLTYIIDYTATNSFGGTVRDQFKHTYDDISYTYDAELLSAEEVANVLNNSTFEAMCDSLYK